MADENDKKFMGEVGSFGLQKVVIHKEATPETIRAVVKKYPYALFFIDCNPYAEAIIKESNLRRNIDREMPW